MNILGTIKDYAWTISGWSLPAIQFMDISGSKISLSFKEYTSEKV